MSEIAYNHNVKIRQRLYAQLSPEAWPKSGLSPVNRVVAVAIIVAVAAAVLETEQALRTEHARVFVGLDVALGLLFVSEYLLRLWVVGENPKYQGVIGRLKYVATPMAVIDLIAVLPFLLDRIRIDRTHIVGSIDPVNPVYIYKVEQIHGR